MIDPTDRAAELPQLSFTWAEGPRWEDVSGREWLLTNGLGGYASGTIAASPTRRYHGLFVPALGTHGRTVMLARLEESVRAGHGEWERLDAVEYADGQREVACLQHLRRFSLRGLMPEWEYQVGETRLLRRLVMVHGENTVFMSYRNLGGPSVRIRLRPFPVFRPHELPVGDHVPMPAVKILRERIELLTEGDHPPLRLRMRSPCDSPFVSQPARSGRITFPVEHARGYACDEVQESPGYFQCELQAGESLALGVSADGWEALARDPEEAFALEIERERRLIEQAPMPLRVGTGARLVLSADQFIIEPRSRPRDEAWARATGQDARSVIAGYHWFTDWGRDTMISLEGLTLATGRHREAAAILRTFQHYVRDGLIPNYFPDGDHDGLYHTADATLWYFHAIDRYLEATGDLEMMRDLFPTLAEIVEAHLRGTRFGIGVDPADGLLRQGEDGFQLTWMDAKCDGWVVTPRRGKTVELNALWFNALRLMADWAVKLGKDPGRYAHHAEWAQSSFNRRFWNEDEGCLYDLIDGELGVDAAVRPNQVFALSLHHPVLHRDRWEAVLEKVAAELLTPVGLRSLSPRHPDYKRAYDGDLRSRDAAYHQGTVWAWLIGPFLDAYLRAAPAKERARELLIGLEAHLQASGLGQVSEIFDASEPYRPRGCIAQAWSVAELLRSWLRTG